MQFDIVSFALFREDLLSTLKWVEGTERDEKAVEFEPRTEDEIDLVSSIKARLLRLKAMTVDYASKVNNATLFPSEVLLTRINCLVAMISTIEENNNKYNKELYEQKYGGMDQSCAYLQTPELEPCQMLILSDVSSRIKELKLLIEKDAERMNSDKHQLEGLFAYLTHLGEFIHSYVYALFTENIQSGSIFHNEQDWLIRSANGLYSTKPSTQEERAASYLENKTMSLEMVWENIDQKTFSSTLETRLSENGEEKEKEIIQETSSSKPSEKKDKEMDKEIEMEIEEGTERKQVKRNHLSTEGKEEVTSAISLRDKSLKQAIPNTMKEINEGMSADSDNTPLMQKEGVEPSKEMERKEKEKTDLPEEISRKRSRRKRKASMTRSTILPSNDLKKGKKSEEEDEEEKGNGEEKGKGKRKKEKARNGEDGEPCEEKNEKEDGEEESEMDDEEDEPPRCIREGEEYQAEVKPFDPEIASAYSKKEYKQEVLWDPNRLSHSELEAFTSIFPADLWENVFEVIVKYDYNLDAAYTDLVENPPVNPITKFSPEDQRRLEENTENMASLHKYFFPYVKNTDVVDLFYHMDASFKDEICPICSTDGQLVYCLKCPRGYHKHCLKLNTKDFICPFCITTRETLSGENFKMILAKYKRHLCRAYSGYDE